MKLNRWRIDRQKLLAISENERALFVLLGHAVNEINVLNKTFYLSTQFSEEPKWRAHAHASQSLVFARALTGKLYEAWQLLQTGYFQTQLSREYHQHFESSVVDALDRLKKYFGRTNLIEVIRNRFAFHYSFDDAKAVLDRDLPDDELVIYLAEDQGNTLYYLSEFVVNTALLRALEAGSEDQALHRLMEESARVVSWLNDVAGAIMFRVVEKYLLDQAGKATFEAVDIGDPVVAESVEIPYFITTTLRQTKESA